jgi:hypothetical protein
MTCPPGRGCYRTSVAPNSALWFSQGADGGARGLGTHTLALGPERRLTSRRVVCTPPVVLLYCCAFGIPSRTCAGLLTTCCGPRDACGLPPRRASHHEQALSLQATETVPEVALGPGQRRDQLQVTPRAHPTSPLCLGRPPPHQRLRESRETPGSPPSAPASSLGPHVSAGATDASASPACGEAWPRRRPAWRRPPCTARTAVCPARSGRALAWIIPGAHGTPWRAGSVPGALRRLRTVALPPHGPAACSRVSQACGVGPWGRRSCYRTHATRCARQGCPVPGREPTRGRVAARVWSRPTGERARIPSSACSGVARPCFPTVGRAPRPAVGTPPWPWSCPRGAGGAGSVSLIIACRTVRRRRFWRAAEAAGGAHSAPRSWPTVRHRWRGAARRVIRRLASVARGAATSATGTRASGPRRAHAPATRRWSGSPRAEGRLARWPA